MLEIRQHFLVEEKASQSMTTTFMDLKKDIVYLLPEEDPLFRCARLDIIARWFPFLTNIQYLSVTFGYIWEAFEYERLGKCEPHCLTKFKGLRCLIVMLPNWKHGKAFPQSIMEHYFERLEKENPGWERPGLKFVLHEEELQDIMNMGEPFPN